MRWGTGHRALDHYDVCKGLFDPFLRDLIHVAHVKLVRVQIVMILEVNYVRHRGQPQEELTAEANQDKSS